MKKLLEVKDKSVINMMVNNIITVELSDDFFSEMAESIEKQKVTIEFTMDECKLV